MCVEEHVLKNHILMKNQTCEVCETFMSREACFKGSHAHEILDM
jgi:hypothetical protein